MFKHLLIWLTAAALLWGFDAIAQDSLWQQQDTTRPGCGVTLPYFDKTEFYLVNDSTLSSTYPAAAKMACGKFMVYFDDIAYSSGDGFAGPYGPTRCATLCSVLTYIQSVYDFSNIPSGEYIRLHVNTSYSATLPTAHAMEIGWGAPFFRRPVAPGAVVNGFVHDYIISGTDPAPGQYHGEIRMNFDKTNLLHRLAEEPVDYSADGLGAGVYVGVPDFQNGLAVPEPCQFDLYSILLHLVNHTLGHYSMKDIVHGGIWTLGAYTSLDTSVRQGPLPWLYPTAFSAPLTPAYLSGSAGFWLDNSPAPYRTMTDLNTHFNESYDQGARYGMGDNEDHVMDVYFIEGKMTRSFSKVELKVGHNILGYSFNPATFSSSSNTALYYTNRRPYCTKNYDFRYNQGLVAECYYKDTIAADFKIVNNTGTSLVMNLWADTTLRDDDGDTIRVIPESLFNIRGCGKGGNNHNQLKLSNGNRTITYTPRSNFYGRAQLGFNVTDGKEKGTFVMYTIDVEKGSNVIAPSFGGDLVLNGGFEEGSEVKLKDTAEQVNNTMYNDLYMYGRRNLTTYASDCNPYSNISIIRNSYVECKDAWTAKYCFGYAGTSFPWPWDSIASKSICQRMQRPRGDVGNRFSGISTQLMFNLADSLRKCHIYALELDVTKYYKRYAPACSSCPDPGSEATFEVGFTDGSRIIKTTPLDAVKNQVLPSYTVGGVDADHWTHITIPFSYCSDKPSTILYVRLKNGSSSGWGYGASIYDHEYFIDNVTLRETNMLVSIRDTFLGNCITRLKALPSVINSCGDDFIYTWKNPAGKVIGTTAVIDVSPSVNTTYTLTVSNGCQSATATVGVQPRFCPCSVNSVLGDTVGFYTLSGLVATAPPPATVFYIPDDITITRSLTLKGAAVLIRPTVKITVLDSVKLTIDSCHLFTCLDTNKLWKGIVLQSSLMRSGCIEVKNNSLIEDAEIAISAVNPRIYGSGDIVSSTNSIYNRNQTDIYIENLNAFSPAKLPFTFTGNVFTARLFTGTAYPGYPRKWPSAKTLKTYADDGTKPSYTLCRYYPKALCKNGIFSNSGLILNKLGNYDPPSGEYSEVVVGGSIDGVLDFNLFDNHGYGINATMSNLSSYNNYFVNISETMNPVAVLTAGTTRYPDAAGIFAANPFSRSPVRNRLQVMNLGGAQFPNANKFHDCIRGVSATGYNTINVSNAYLTSSRVINGNIPGTTYSSSTASGVGILLTASDNTQTINVGSNQISNLVAGLTINLTTTGAVCNTVVNNNRFYAANPDLSISLTGNQSMTEAIYAYANTMMFGTVATGTLQLNNNSCNKVLNGIRVMNLKNFNPEANNNYITVWDRSPYIGAMQYGINFSQTKGGTISGNTINDYYSTTSSDIVRGVYAAFNTSLTVCNNTENALGRGFDFTQLTAQPGTIWVGNTMTANLRGFVLGSDIGHQSVSGSGPLVFVGTSQNKWNGLWPGAKFQTYTEGASILSTNSKLYVRNIPSGIIELPSNNQGFPTTNRYQNTGSASGSLITSQANALRCSNNIFPRPFPLLFGDLVWGVLADTLGSRRANQWMAQYNLWQEGLDDASIGSNSPVYAQFMTAAAATRFQWLSNIDAALSAGNTQSAQSLLSSPQAAVGAIVLSPELTVTDLSDADAVVGHYTSYYRIYSKHLQGTLDSNDTLALAAIARLCPAADGGAVYLARSLYGQLSGAVFDYNDEACMQEEGGQQRSALAISGEQSQQYSLYPNPNNGRMLLRQALSDAAPVQISIYDMQGRIVMRSVLNFGNTRQQTLQIGAVAAGLYLLQLQDQAGRSYHIKFNVQ